MAEGGFRPPKQWILTENESITSYSNWQSNMLYNLSLNNEFATFLESEWGTHATLHRGLVDDSNEVTDEAKRKTRVQKKIILERMLGLIAQYAPSLLRNEVIKKSTSLSWIWERIRKYYSFNRSEVHFLKLANIKRDENERYETFYQRIMAHLEDNLLTVSSGITHDGAAATTDEVMSPTTERLAVYLWLSLIDERLPLYVARVYAHDLQTKSLKDLQPQIAQAMESLLSEITTQEDIQIQYARSSYPKSRNRKPFIQKKAIKFPSSKVCILCKAAGRPYQGHDISSCWHISKFERLEISKAMQIEVDCDDDQEEHEEVAYSKSEAEGKRSAAFQVASISKVQCDISPHFYAFCGHHPCHVVVDTGATSSVVSRSFLKAAGIPIGPTAHSARTADKSPLDVKGEVHIALHYSDKRLPITALVIDTLECDILAGVPFCKHNDIEVHLKQEQISIQGLRISYGTKHCPARKTADIYLTESFVLRNDKAKVVLPGEYVEIRDDKLKGMNDEIALEPRLDSPMNGEWPAPFVTRVINGSVRIPNLSSKPVQLSRLQHIGQARRTIDETLMDAMQKEKATPTSSICKLNERDPNQFYSDLVTIDPDSQLSRDMRMSFMELHRSYDDVFTENFGAYNDNSGRIRADINLGSVVPPPTKGKLPFYNQSNLRRLQEEADKLEMLGVLARPEDVNVQVKYASPSFLVKKPDGGMRFVTAFNALSQYTRVLPTVSNTCNDVLRRVSSWKYIIQSDLTKSFYQIRSSVPFLGTVTPFKGLRVYLRSAMGMPGSSEHLHELLSRVLGDFMQEGFLTILADDIYIGAHTVEELLTYWARVLNRLHENNLSLSPAKTIICPQNTVILGWKWSLGSLSVSPHKISPLVAMNPPETCTGMRSFIGAYKALSRCIPKYSTLMSPLEDALKGLQGCQKISWSSELHAYFKKAQDSLSKVQSLTIPTPADKLVMTVDASPKNKGLGATLFVVRDGKQLVAEFHSFKLKSHQMNWLPCEMEALVISEGINYFSPYIRESQNPIQIMTDSKPCVQAYGRLCKGKFSASSRVSTFLSSLSRYKVMMCHISGNRNKCSDFSSRNPISCRDSSCQICKFVNETALSVVNAITVSDVLSGSAKMPFLNVSAWKSAQQDCPDLRRVFAHLVQGTRPTKKTRNLTTVRRYLNVAQVDDNGVLVVHKQDPFLHQRKLILVPAQILSGILTAMHLHFKHPTRHQLEKLFNRFFYAVKSNEAIEQVVKQCDQCNSLKSIPKELMLQTTSDPPTAPGQQFACDVMRRNRQKIFVTRDTHSSFMSAAIIPDEKAESLRSALLMTTIWLRSDSCSIRVDGATGFQSLSDDKMLSRHGIKLDFGRLKNPNKIPIAERGVQELEGELLKHDPSGSAVDDLTLQLVVDNLNSRIRNRGLSAKEIVMQRDQHTRQQLSLDDDVLSKQQEMIRRKNHPCSAASKAKGAPKAKDADVRVGDLVYLKGEKDKLKARERYVITKVDQKEHFAFLQKLSRGKFMARQYKVPLTEIYKAVPDVPKASCKEWDNKVASSDESEDDYVARDADSQLSMEEGLERSEEEDEDNDEEEDDEEETAVLIVPDRSADVENTDLPRRYPMRDRREPVRYAGDEWDRS